MLKRLRSDVKISVLGWKLRWVIIVGDEPSLGRSQLSREVWSMSQVHQVTERTSLSMVQNQRKHNTHDFLAAAFWINTTLIT